MSTVVRQQLTRLNGDIRRDCLEGIDEPSTLLGSSLQRRASREVARDELSSSLKEAACTTANFRTIALDTEEQRRDPSDERRRL